MTAPTSPFHCILIASLILLATNLLSTSGMAQCAGFPATIADADCSGGSAMSNNMNANSGTYGYCGSSSTSASFNGINLNGATLRICGNTTLGFGSWNSGSLVISCGATVTINGNLTLNGSSGIVNYSTLRINGSLNYQNANNFVYNESATSRITVTGNINLPTNNGTNGYLRNAGYIKVGGTFNAGGGTMVCFMDGGRLECNNFTYMDQNANCNGVPGDRFTFGSASGSCIFRYINGATLYKAFTTDSRWNVYQASGSSQTIAAPCNGNATGWGSATILASAPAITAPSGEQPCNTITCLTLPVEMLHCKVRPSGDHMILSWQTATESNSRAFLVERSNDALQWTQIASIPAAGNSIERQTYSYTDLQPLAGINYYRLVQQDANDRRHYFEPVYANSSGRSTFSSVLFPVPSNDRYVTLEVSGNTLNDLRIDVRNLLGEPVNAGIPNADTSGTTQRYQLSLPGEGQVFFITVWHGNTLLAKHKATFIP